MSVSAGRAQLDGALSALEAWGAARDWIGTDPYEGLNAIRLAGPLKRSSMGRRLLVQLVKRSPIDFRPLLGIPRRPNAAALAWVLSAYSVGGFLPEVEELARLNAVARRLEAMRCAGYDEPCWSYHFDVETRVFFYAKTTPNTIATAFAAQAMLDAFERTGDSRLLDLAVGAADFFVRHVPQTEAEGGAYFGYLPGDRSPIHNANALVCALLARVSRHVCRPDLRAAAETGVGHTLAHQRDDGSWWYGELPNLRWVDGFHTGYVLDSLMACATAGVAEERIARALGRGLAYYRENLFLPDGTPKQFSTSVYPIDAQSVAQGIQTFALAAANDPRHLDMAWRVFGFAVRRMRKRDGSYIFQRRRFWANRAPHVRWVAAPIFLALARLRAIVDGRQAVTDVPGGGALVD